MKKNKISVIICSRREELDDSFRKNIVETIGWPHEIITINNSENKFSIFEAYNIGIKESKGDCLVFLHEDIFIHTDGWGRILYEIFHEDTQVGLIGIAGSKMKSKMPSAWWDCPADLRVINIIQHIGESNIQIKRWHSGFNNKLEEEVAVIDGVFMALRKDRSINFRTDIEGYHNYDLNISLEYVLKKYRTLVTSRILIEHFSIGTLNKSWYISAIQFHKKYHNYLPIVIGTDTIGKSTIFKQEYKNAISFIRGLLNHNLYKGAFFYWAKLFLLKPYSKFHKEFILFFIRILR